MTKISPKHRKKRVVYDPIWNLRVKLLTKGRDIRSASNVEQNTIPDGGRYVAKSLARKTFSKGAEKLEGILREGAGRGRLESKMLTLYRDGGWSRCIPPNV